MVYVWLGVAPLPVVASPVRVAGEIVAYAWATVLLSIVLWPLATGWVYGVLAIVAGAGFIGEVTSPGLPGQLA